MDASSNFTNSLNKHHDELKKKKKKKEKEKAIM